MLSAVFIDYERKPNRCGVPPDNAYSGIDSEHAFQSFIQTGDHFISGREMSPAVQYHDLNIIGS